MSQVLLIVRSLDMGGAERQLTSLVTAMHRRGYSVSVAFFYPSRFFKSVLEEQNVAFVSLGKRGRWDLILFTAKFIFTIKKLHPEVVYAFLGGASIFSSIAKLIFPNLKIIWSIRSSYMNLSRYHWIWKVEKVLLRLLVSLTDRIVCNSHAGKSHLMLQGYPSKKIVVIPNGLDTGCFRPYRDKGLVFRRRWASYGTKLIGMVARLDPMKDHEMFLRAISFFLKKRADVRFLCVGSDRNGRWNILKSLAESLGVSQFVFWAGELEDMVAVYNAMDINTLCSWGEGFPNAVAEAMACGVPCVVTDVGDCAYLVADTGIVVPPGDALALACAWEEMLNGDLHEMGRRARERVVKYFGVDRMVDETVKIFEEVLGKPLGRKSIF